MITKTAEHWRRIRQNFIVLTILVVVFTFVFTTNILYCSIVAGAAFLAAFGFRSMMIQVDKFIYDGKKSQAHFFLFQVLKFIVLSLAFYGASKISPTAALLFILGVSVLVLAILLEAVYLMVRGLTT